MRTIVAIAVDGSHGTATTITVGRLADGGVQPQVAVDGAEAFM